METLLEQRTMPGLDLVLEWERTHSPESRRHLLAACAADPTVVLTLIMRVRTLAEANDRKDGQLEAAQELLDEVQDQDGATFQVAAFIQSGPEMSGHPTAIVDKGGYPVVIPMQGDGLPLDALRQHPMVLLGQGDKIECVLPDFEPPGSELATVRSVMDEGAVQYILAEFHGDDTVTVAVPDKFRGQLEPGDKVLVNRKYGLALKRVDKAQAGSQWRVKHIPAERFTDVAGLDEAKSIFMSSLIYPRLHPEAARTLGLAGSTNYILTGPQGSGKSMTVKALAGHMHDLYGDDFEWHVMRGAENKTSLYGQSSQRVREFFDNAATRAREGKRILLAWDEGESVASARTAYGEDYGHHADRDNTSTLIGCLDGLLSDPSLDITFVLITNLPQSLDSAFVDRCILVPIQRPTAETSDKLIAHHISPRLPLDTEYKSLVRRCVDFVFADQDTSSVLARVHFRDSRQQPKELKRPDLFTGRIVSEAVESAKRSALADFAEGRTRSVVVTQENLIRQLDEKFIAMARLVNASNIASYVDWPSAHSGQVVKVEHLAESPAATFQFIT